MRVKLRWRGSWTSTPSAGSTSRDTFPILWNTDGDVVESFSPDFYLPDLDLYLEMTTLRQKLVRKKNRKLRRLRELYPSVEIKLFYARDFRALMLKYGRLALADGLSGTSGQVAAPHVTAAAADDAIAAELACRDRGPRPPGPAARPPNQVTKVSTEGSAIHR